ncbi:MAG: hypothetical protein ABSD10_01950 [Candidatus Saccharimonadales bacterium]
MYDKNIRGIYGLRQKLRLGWLLAVIVLAVIGLVIFDYTRPLPLIRPQAQTPSPIAAQAIDLPWPTGGQAAIGAVGFGVLATNHTEQAIPMASVAKIITALAVLKQKPLELGQQGPTITFDSTDVSYYQTYAAEGGSVAKVVIGENISEYQVLQTMLLPSANNIAESLARWAFGSPNAYIAYVNQFVKTLGMTQTNVADASGFVSQTTSTAKDLVILGEAAMNNSVLAQIVGQSQATVPVAGTVDNTNWLLGSDGFVGIKTGNTDQDPGCYLFAVSQIFGGQPLYIVGAVMGMPTLTDAISNGRTLADAAKTSFSNPTIVKAGQIIGAYKLPWGGSIQAVAQKDLAVVTWKGVQITPIVSLNPLHASAAAGMQIGTLSAASGQETVSVPVVIKQAVPKPPLLWRLFRL